MGLTIVVVLVAAALVGLVAELVGVSRSKHGKVDTYTELVRTLRRQVPWVGIPLLSAITVLCLWAPLHLWEVIP